MGLELMAEHTEHVLTGGHGERWLQRAGSRLHPRAKTASQIKTQPASSVPPVQGGITQRSQGEKPSDLIESQGVPPAQRSSQCDKCQGPIQN